MERIEFQGDDTVISFGKWEGMSYCYHEDNDPYQSQVHDEEEYILDELYYTELNERDYLSKYGEKSTFYTLHNYRYLMYGDDTYEAGETYTTLYYVDSEGSVIEV